MNSAFDGWTALFPGELARHRQLTQVKHYEKGEFLLRTGETALSAFFVTQGCLRSYMIDSKGKEHILQFAPEGWFISDMAAIFTQTPAQIYIDAVETSRVDVLNVAYFQNQPLPDQTIEVMQQQLVRYQNNIMAQQRRIMQLLSFTATERYEEFIRIYPTLANRLPLKLIAAYLGITPESLSRVRKLITDTGP